MFSESRALFFIRRSRANRLSFLLQRQIFSNSLAFIFLLQRVFFLLFVELLLCHNHLLVSTVYCDVTAVWPTSQVVARMKAAKWFHWGFGRGGYFGVVFLLNNVNIKLGCFERHPFSTSHWRRESPQ